MSQEQYEDLILNIVKVASNNPVYLRAHDIIYVKDKVDLHVGFDLFNMNALAFIVVSGSVSIVSVTDESKSVLKNVIESIKKVKKKTRTKRKKKRKRRKDSSWCARTKLRKCGS